MKDLSTALVGTNLRKIVEVWSEIQSILGVKRRDAAAFVETFVEKLKIQLYLDDEVYGLWFPCEESAQWQLMSDISNSDCASDENEDPGAWGSWRILPTDYDNLIDQARVIADRSASLNGQSGKAIVLTVDGHARLDAEFSKAKSNLLDLALKITDPLGRTSGGPSIPSKSVAPIAEQVNAPEFPDWKYVLAANVHLTAHEVACAFAGVDPHTTGSSADDNGAVQRYLTLINRATLMVDRNERLFTEHIEFDKHGEPIMSGIKLATLATWCARKGLKYPLPNAPTMQATNPEALAEIERLKAEVERLKTELTEARDGASFADDERWPEELDIAMMAWRAALSGAEQAAKKPKVYMLEWLEKNCGEKLNSTQRDRIATVANWDKTPGPK
jgi:hypothetical protein